MRINVPALGKAVRDKRARDGVNQTTVANHIGVAQGVISRIENGYGGIDGDLYVKFCEWLDVSFDQFVTEATAEAA